MPLALIAGVGAYDIYRSMKHKKNILTDKPANIKDWELDLIEIKTVAELDKLIDKSKNNAERRKLIKNFYDIAKKGYVLSVLNVKTNKRIYINSRSKKETAEHASKSKKSSKAVLDLRHILKYAKPFDDYIRPIKDNTTQNKFIGVRIFYFVHHTIGAFKITIGVRESDGEYVQYCLTAIE